MSSDDQPTPDAAFEQLLRGRLHELADHAPTAVPPMSGLTPPTTPARLRSNRPWRGPWLAAVAGTAIVGAGVGAWALTSGNDAPAPVDTVIPVDTVEPGSSVPESSSPVTTVEQSIPSTSVVAVTTAAPSTTRPEGTVSTTPPPTTTGSTSTSPLSTSPPTSGSLPPVPTVEPPLP
jgi:hypothetical protein